ncbi:MAG: DUF1934 domain-containing protein [Acetivibrionales bacterium]|jgi:uncharacterized beta-barrel protein YwiB (DUF1934 family)|nr:DUF1934 domain-containing protein [Clostridiaceae bacterium]
MQKQVLITVNSTIDDPSGERDKMSFVTEGILIKEDNEYIVSYEESEITGLKGTTTTLRVGKNSVILARHGSVDSLMLFEVGKTHETGYDTSHGSITLGITAKNVDVDFNESGGNIKVDYILEYNRTYGGKNSIDVHVRERIN